MLALDTSNGSQRWQSADIGAQSGNGRVYTPVLSADGSVLYTPSENKQVWAFLTSDGTTKWISATDKTSAASLVLSSDGNTIYMKGASKQLYAWNTANGSERWISDSVTQVKPKGPAGISSDGTTVMNAVDAGSECRVIGFSAAAGGETWRSDAIGAGKCSGTGVVSCATSQHQCQATLTAAPTTATPTTMAPTWAATIAGILYCVTTYYHYVRVARLGNAYL